MAQPIQAIIRPSEAIQLSPKLHPLNPILQQFHFLWALADNGGSPHSPKPIKVALKALIHDLQAFVAAAGASW